MSTNNSNPCPLTGIDIDIRLEKRIDRIDKRFIAGEFEQAEYDAMIRAAYAWYDQQIDNLEAVNGCR